MTPIARRPRLWTLRVRKLDRPYVRASALDQLAERGSQMGRVGGLPRESFFSSLAKSAPDGFTNACCLHAPYPQV